MREFKSGTLKSGGSGKKVTNPKQAIAIALSEANAMNQGGMMQNPVMQRPMFQNPMQRESMGIMAGVAPIQGYREGGSAAPDYTPKFLREEQPEEDGLAEQAFKFLVVDYDDPVDVALASGAAALMATGVAAPGAVALTAARLGLKGRKVMNALDKAQSLGERLAKPTEGMIPLGKLEKDPSTFSKVAAPIGGYLGARETQYIPEYAELAGGVANLAKEKVMGSPQQMYAGGIASLSNGGFISELISKIPGKKGEIVGQISDVVSGLIKSGRAKIEDAIDLYQRKQISKKELDDIVQETTGVEQGRMIQPGERLDLKTGQISKVGDDGVDITRGVDTIDTPIGPLQRVPDSRVKMTEGDLSAPTSTPSKPTQMVEGDIAPPPKSVEVPKTAVTEKAADAVKQPITQRVRQSVPGQIVSGALSPITRPLKVGVPVLAGGVALDRLLQSGKIQEAYDLMINDPRVKKVIDNFGVPAAEAAKEIFGPYYDALFPDTGERVELTDSVMEQVDTNKDGRISKEESAAIKKKADEAAKKEKQGTEQKETETGTPKPVPSGLAKFFKKFDDPRLQYQLARASQPTEGFVPRNFFSDMVLAGAEYDQLQGKDETALMQNYEFLKQAGKSDDEIFNLLLSKDTASDIAKTLEDRVYSLFGDIDSNPNYAGLSTEEKLTEARRLVYGGGSLDAPAADSKVVETVDLD